jgi:dTDP-4-amino-4,6-dideoxygalactose transaminase
MIFTDNEDLYDRLKSIRVHGQGKDKYDNIRIGLNGRLDTIQAAILLAKFELFQDEIIKKQDIADIYTNGLKDTITTPHINKDKISAWAQYSVLSDDRDKIIEHLNENSIPAMVYYRTPLPYLKAYDSLGYKQGEFPISEEVSKRIFSLPMHAYFKDDEQEMVIEAVRKGNK